jgi:hypothetical protein
LINLRDSCHFISKQEIIINVVTCFVHTRKLVTSIDIKFLGTQVDRHTLFNSTVLESCVINTNINMTIRQPINCAQLSIEITKQTKEKKKTFRRQTCQIRCNKHKVSTKRNLVNYLKENDWQFCKFTNHRNFQNRKVVLYLTFAPRRINSYMYKVQY